jgi:preprotein translocase subunit Sss1
MLLEFQKITFKQHRSMFLKSLKNDNDGPNLRKNRRIKKIIKYLKSPKGQKFLKRLRINLIGLGLIGIGFYFYQDYIFLFLSKLFGRVKDVCADQDSTINDVVETAQTSNIRKWYLFGATLVIVGLGVIKSLNNQETSIEIEIQPEYIQVNRKNIRILVGVGLVFGSYPAMLVFGLPGVGAIMYVTGWQLATHP